LAPVGVIFIFGNILGNARRRMKRINQNDRHGGC
jgi:hypothetical protein